MLDSGTVGPVQIAAAMLSGNRLRQTVHIHHSPSSKIGTGPLKGVRVTAGLVESNGSLPPGL